MKVVLVLFACFVLSSCAHSTDADKRDSERNTTVDTNKSFAVACPTVSSETAILIVKGRTYADYGLENRDVQVDDQGDSWKITLYQIRDRHTDGGDPIFWISKANGSFVKVIEAK